MSQAKPGVRSEEDVRKAVRNTRRRYVLYHLCHSGGVAQFDDLVERIAAWETESPSGNVPARNRESVYSSLYQTHLPKLERIGLVTHDTSAGTVELTEKGEHISVYCAANTLPATAFPKVTLGLGGLVLSLLVAGHFGAIAAGLTIVLAAAGVAGLVLALVRQVRSGHAWHRRYRQRGPDYIVEIDER